MIYVAPESQRESGLENCRRYLRSMCMGFCRSITFPPVSCHYLRRRIAIEGTVALGVTLRVYVRRAASCLYHVSATRRISLSGEGNARYPVLSR